MNSCMPGLGVRRNSALRSRYGGTRGQVSNTMDFEYSAPALAWLAQFSAVDREVARQFLRRLRLVSEAEFDSGIQAQIDSIVTSLPRENFALLSITEPPNAYSSEVERREPGSSADRIRHVIENAHRVHGPRVNANPTLTSMRAQRIKNIVLVEDYVGSGTRVSRFWKELVSASVKSWVSYGWTKIWLVVYGAQWTGLSKVVRSIRGLDSTRVRCVLKPVQPGEGLTVPMRLVFSKYGAAAQAGGAGLGFGEGGCTTVFQHGCPNNAPLVLWKAAPRFVPLFPRRGVPVELQPYFGEVRATERAELLWDSQQYQIAIALLEGVKRKSAGLGQWELIAALALSARHQGWDEPWLAARMRLPENEIRELRRAANHLLLIDVQTDRLTRFGTELLDRLRGTGRSPRKQATGPALHKLNQLYYPDSCGGKEKH